jgi:hypothetical protein
MQVGYSFSAGIGAFQQRIENANGTAGITQVRASYGKGVNLSYGLGYMFNDNFGAELSLSYLIGGINKLENFYRVDQGANPYTIEQQVKIRSNLFRINPCFLFVANTNKLAPYAKIGFIIGWGSGKHEATEDVKYENGEKASGKFEWKFKGASPMGITSSLGIKTQTKGDHLDFFIELSYISMAGSFKKGTKTHHIINGTEYIQDLTTSEKEEVFVDKVYENSVQDSSKPKQVLKGKQSYDSIGFNFGIIFKM